jgi:hypothetical protein
MPTGDAGKPRFRQLNRATKSFWVSDAVVRKQKGRQFVSIRRNLERVMSMLSGNRPEGWDPALWSIGTVIGVAILYVACLA